MSNYSADLKAVIDNLKSGYDADGNKLLPVPGLPDHLQTPRVEHVTWQEPRPDYLNIAAWLFVAAMAAFIVVAVAVPTLASVFAANPW